MGKSNCRVTLFNEEQARYSPVRIRKELKNNNGEGGGVEMF